MWDVNHGKRKGNSQGRGPSTQESNSHARGPIPVSRRRTRGGPVQRPGRRATALVRSGKEARSNGRSKKVVQVRPRWKKKSAGQARMVQQEGKPEKGRTFLKTNGMVCGKIEGHTFPTENVKTRRKAGGGGISPQQTRTASGRNHKAMVDQTMWTASLSKKEFFF